MKKNAEDFEADFGFMAPHRTKTKCKNPVFADHYLHRIAMMKDYHIGSVGDVDPSGAPGYITKSICTGCGKKFKASYFVPDSQTKKFSH